MKTKKRVKIKLPVNIRNELQILYAMRAYNSIKGGKGKTIMQQYDALYAYYHDKPPSRPSQIKMLFEGGNTYRDLYKRQQRVATAKKDNKDSTTEFVLKKSCIVIPPGDFAQRRRSTHSISRKKLHPAHFSLLVEHSW